jgi:signal transduction histidine kinase
MSRLPQTLMRGRWAVFLALPVLAVLGIIDYLTGHHFALSAFYLAPISWAGWVRGRKAGLIFAGLSAAIWLTADLMTSHIYPYPVTPYWNALTLLALFVVVVHLLSKVQTANQHLEDTVQRRTSALIAEMAERKRLEKAQLQAERLAMVGTIAAQVAHEVRNPLGSITLNLDLIAKEIEGRSASHRAEVQEGLTLVNEMREEVRRIQRVIEDYLKFARLPRIQSQPLKLNDFLEQKLTFMEPTFRDARVRLRTEFDAGLTTINADAQQLWQAILNLVKNSLEAMPAGGTLAVSTRRENGEVLVRVADTGKGMSEDQLKQLFVPFFTTKPRGTGLGLPLAQRILHDHGAQLACASTPGQGTAFTIHFPLQEAA